MLFNMFAVVFIFNNLCLTITTEITVIIRIIFVYLSSSSSFKCSTSGNISSHFVDALLLIFPVILSVIHFFLKISLLIIQHNSRLCSHQ